MQFLYIDESGTMTNNKNTNSFPFFVISIVNVFDKEKLKRVVKRFISKNINELKTIDDGKMFKDNKFLELKGSTLTRDLKIQFASYLCKSNLFEIYYIIIDNKLINEKTYENKARAFNYFIDLCLTYQLHHNNLPKDDYCIQIDERNIKTNAQKTLEDYLAIELGLKQELINKVSVKYCDSCNNLLIQLSDFFANLCYSHIMTENSYTKLFEELENKKIIKHIFKFPNIKKKKGIK